MINCSFESGGKALLRHVTVGAIIVKNGKILLSKRGTYDGKPILESGKWSLIGGFLERGETTIDGIKREVEEETGCKITNVKLLRINDSPDRPKEDRQNVDFIFTAEAINEPRDNSEEVKELKWFPLNNLPKEDEWAFDHLDSVKIYLQKPL